MHGVVMELKFIALFFLIALATACTSASHVKPISDSPQEYDPDIEETNKLIQQSDDYHKSLKRKGLLYIDDETNQYIIGIGHKLAPDFLKINEDLNLYIVKDATANAAALPNGNIYINIGLLSVAENEDQLAAIIAHEIAHVIYRHSLKSMLNRQDTRRAANIADIFLLGTGLINISANSSLASYNREHEREADVVSLTYMQHAGYDLQQSPEILKIFQTLPESLTVKNSAYNSHPKNKKRIQYLEKEIKSSYSGIVREPVVSEIFNKSRSKIVEENVKIRLNDHQYKLVLLTLAQADKYYKNAALIQYYRGEVYRLMAENPDKAAKEIEWLVSGIEETEQELRIDKDLYTGGENAPVVKKDINYFIKNKAVHYDKAESFYKEALELRPDLALAYKGLGLVYYSKNDYKQALIHLNTYIEMAETPSDSLYIKRLIRNSKKRG
jgi:predicted Zn-dependent protease